LIARLPEGFVAFLAAAALMGAVATIQYVLSYGVLDIGGAGVGLLPALERRSFACPLCSGQGIA